MELSDLRRFVDDVVELYHRNLESTPSQSTLQQQLHDLERESSDPSFWEESNASRNSHVTAQLSNTSRLLTRLETWQSHQDDAIAALEMLQDANLISNSEERSLLIQECITSATLLQQDLQSYELQLLIEWPNTIHVLRDWY